ncbi:MAG TPA: carboxypeptidase-like regulatory domain-containing protein, partial [Verrucomicrobiae bacterium]|nr:carboxypeptidase-like regulatory domain-containing protein [Verrucomicrobiae bacterium]
MKIGFEKLPVLSAFLASWLAASSTGFAQQTLTVSPSSTSNTYTGVVTLNITGLTNGEKVSIEKWLDLNANGLIDPGELLVDAFKITDNDLTNNLIGGVMDISVPWDTNATNGAITTTLNFAGPMAIENMTAHFIYRLVSPTGRFAPVTALFTVTNANQAQSVSGTVYSNGLTPLPYAVVVAIDQQAGNPTGSVVADSNGHYFLTLPSSTYSLIAGSPNYYFDQSVGPSVVLTNGVAATNNLSLTNGTVTLSGGVFNAANSNGIPGLLLQLGSGNLFAIDFTDTNGNYSAAVTPSMWTVQPTKERLARRAFVVPKIKTQWDTTTNSVSDANIALPHATALFYGRITDNSNNPFANIEVDASAGNDYSAKGYSDPDGNYGVAALGGLTNEFWNCGVNNGIAPIDNYILNQFNTLTLSSNQTVLQNFTALPATARISGRAVDNSGNPIVGVQLNAVAFIGGNNYQSLDGTTDNSGNYSLAVATGNWNVNFLTGGGDSGNLDVQGYVDLFTPHNVSI